ncbi:serine/threonine protein kinase [Niabella insulamsoli]|uniref:serine/threonine protein kinase n=1 Tax=Niabella insulamsoli TaxID=3144874 RepID=UPI0031FBFB6C
MENKGINGYVLKYKLGDGGMADVWYAENYLQKPAAVKILRAKFCDDPEIVARFQNEARLMVRLNHPAIRNILDLGEIDGRPCMVMEYLEGQDLSKRMKHGERFSNEQLMAWWNDTVDALQYTHRKGIVHRDIKPANLFVTENGNIKLLDFGVAKIKDNITVTQTGSRMGTLMYMSPEQVYDVKNLTGKTDAYSLAVTFYHLVTGQPPYDSSKISDFEIQESIVRKPIDLSALDAPWQTLLPAYFHKKPEDRPELHKIDLPEAEAAESTLYIDPAEATVIQQQRPSAEKSNTQVYVQPKPAGRRLFYLFFPIAVILGLIAFALNKDKITNYLKQDEGTQQTQPANQRKASTTKKQTPKKEEAPVIPPADTINSAGEDGSNDQVIVSVDLEQKEAAIKDFIRSYYQQRSNCGGLSRFFNNTVKQYYNKSNVPLKTIEAECEGYHGKWRFTEAEINNQSYVFTHNENGKSYVDFNMLYHIKQNEADDWISYNIDVSVIIDENNKIERIVERRIEKI